MRNLKRWAVIQGVTATAVLLAFTGCKTSSSSHDERSDGRLIDDKEITQNVQKALKEEPIYKFDSVDTKTFGGIVQLSGFVNTEGQKRRAGEVAQEVSGVRQVENGIALKPAPAPMNPTGSTNGTSRVYSD
jgi:osmotically-inducible protein OsmY